MNKSPGKSLFIIAIFTILSFVIALPQNLVLPGMILEATLHIQFGNVDITRNFDLKLGLDLVGGSHFVYEADTSSLSDADNERALTGLQEVISKRINLFGVSEANVQTARFEGKDRIIVELPGVTDTSKAKDLIGKTAQLVFVEFKDQPAPELLLQLMLKLMQVALLLPKHKQLPCRQI